MRERDAQPKTIENKVVVPARLQINEMSLASKNLFEQVVQGAKSITRDEALRMGYRADEVDSYFGTRK